MRDHVFIIWSGERKTAEKVKVMLEEEYKYKCTIGGNADNDSTYASVGDTVIQQMKFCNQAIVIFQNRDDGKVSNNLFFELGYVFSMYGPKKVHCVKKADEQIVLPSDFDNSFVEGIPCESEEQFVSLIVKYFIQRQKMTITENKMYLINNRYKMHDYIQRQYSATQGSLCSEYELAQYVLFYTHAGFMFDDKDRILKEYRSFHKDNHTRISDELQIALNMGIAFQEMLGGLKLNDQHNCYIEKDVFRKFRDVYVQSREALDELEEGGFVEWAKLFIAEHLLYTYCLVANNEELPEKTRTAYYQKAIECAQTSIKEADFLSTQPHVKESNDRKGFLSLFYAYIYRNLFLCYKYLGDANKAIEYLKKTRKERAMLKTNFEEGSLDSKLHENFMMEYYLTLSECMEYADELDLDEEDVEDCKEDIQKFLQQLNDQDDTTVYIEKIRQMIS